MNHGTFNTALAATVPDVAVMVVEPIATAVANPLSEMVATAGLLDAHIFILEMSNAGLFEHVAVAVYPSDPATASDATAGVMVMAFKLPLVIFNTALAAIPCPVQALTVALPGLMPTTCPFIVLAMATPLLAGSISQYTPLVTFNEVLSE